MASGKQPEIDLGQTELRLVRGDGQVATLDVGKRAAEAISVDHRDGRLREEAQRAAAPFLQQTINAIVLLRLLAFQIVKEFLEVHAGAERISGAGENHNRDAVVVAQVFQHLRHVHHQLRIHGVLLVGAIHDDLGHLASLLDQHRLVTHCLSPADQPLLSRL